MEGSYLMLTLTGLMKTLDTSNLDLQVVITIMMMLVMMMVMSDDDDCDD